MGKRTRSNRKNIRDPEPPELFRDEPVSTRGGRIKELAVGDEDIHVSSTIKRLQMMKQLAKNGAKKSGKDATGASQKRKGAVIGMQKGESMRQFEKRIKTETRQVLLEEVRNAKKVTAKRKEYLKRRKEKRKEKRQNMIQEAAAAATDSAPKRSEANASDDDDDPWSNLKDSVHFGEQADRPPALHFNPKALVKKKDGPVNRADLANAEYKAREMERLRDNVISQYRKKKDGSGGRLLSALETSKILGV